MLRILVSILAGLLVAIVLGITIEMINHLIIPENQIGHNTDEDVNAYLLEVPALYLFLIAFGHFLSLTAGNIVGLLIARGNKLVAIVITLIFILFLLFNIPLKTELTWFILTEIALLTLGLLISLRVIRETD